MDSDAPVIDLARLDPEGEPVDGGHLPETTDDTSTDPAATTGWRWLRRLGVAAVVVLAVVAIGFQVQVSKVRDQVERAETARAQAESDEESAQIRLASVDARMELAEIGEAGAQGVLDQSRTDMAAQGIEEAALGDVQRQTARNVKDLRRQNATVAAAIAEQSRVQPAAGACVFDLLRSLGRVRGGNSGAAQSEPCKTVASHAPGQG